MDIQILSISIGSLFDSPPNPLSPIPTLHGKPLGEPIGTQSILISQ